MKSGESFGKGLIAASLIIHSDNSYTGLKHEDKDLKEIFTTQDTKLTGLAGNFFKLKLYVKGSTNSNITNLLSFCQEVSGLGVKRDVQSFRAGGDTDKVYYSVGGVSYDNLTVKNVLIKDKLFLDWLFSGNNLNAIYKGKLELEIPEGWIFTFQDAFPTAWSGLSLVSGKESDIVLVQKITIAYSRFEYALVTPPPAKETTSTTTSPAK